MMIFKKFILLCFSIILFINLVNAIPQIEINVEPIFYEGDIIEFSYEMISSGDEIIKYFGGADCGENNPQVLLELKEVSLKANEPFYSNYTFAELDSSFVSGKCNASVTILEPYLIFKEEPFEISVPPSFSFEIKLDKKVFIKNEEVHFFYISDVFDIKMEAILTYPDKTTQQLTLPSSIKAEQIGTYELEVTASKEAYKTITTKEQFGVIGKQAEIKTVSLADYDSSEGFESNLWIWIIGILIIFIIIVIYLYNRIKKG